VTDLEGKIVLVVGASGVLGGLIAERMTEAGSTVIAGDLRSGAAELVRSAEQEHGRVDGVVIAAGVVAFGAVRDLDADTLHELFTVNSTSPIELISAAIPLLEASAAEKREPFVVTMSGIVSEQPTAGMAAYSASKSALAAFGMAASRELRRSGIRFLDAKPGHTETGLATRAIAGTAPAFPTGLDPAAVADRIVKAVIDDERELPSTAFAG
jgi:NAD(P)-dependent dehydrogenase (short-subunit alcohol dehydrogenase family)